MSDTKITEATSALRVYEANIDAAGMSQLTKTQMLQIIAEQQSAQGDKISATALQAIREAKAAQEAASYRSMVSAGLLITGGIFGLYAGLSNMPGMNRPVNVVPFSHLDPTTWLPQIKRIAGVNASLFETGNNVWDSNKLRKIGQQGNQLWGSVSQAATTTDKVIGSRTEANRVELRSEQQIAQSEQQTADADRHRKQQRRDQVDGQLSTQEQQEFATKKAIVTGT